MEKVVVSVDGSAASRAAVRWCAEHLPPGATVVVVCGISEFGELVISVPPFDAAGTTIEECLNGSWCEPLRRAGLRCQPRLVHRRQVPALLEVVERERPDALVIGIVSHHGIEGLLGWGPLNQVVHHAPCPLVLVPAGNEVGEVMSAPIRGPRATDARSAHDIGDDTPVSSPRWWIRHPSRVGLGGTE